MEQTNVASSPREEMLFRFFKTLRGSLLLSTVAFGFVLLFIAAIFNSSILITQEDGVLAGMIGVFGLSAIIAGSSFYVGLKIVQRH